MIGKRGDLRSVRRTVGHLACPHLTTLDREVVGTLLQMGVCAGLLEVCFGHVLASRSWNDEPSSSPASDERAMTEQVAGSGQC